MQPARHSTFVNVLFRVGARVAATLFGVKGEANLFGHDTRPLVFGVHVSRHSYAARGKIGGSEHFTSFCLGGGSWFDFAFAGDASGKLAIVGLDGHAQLRQSISHGVVLIKDGADADSL